MELALVVVDFEGGLGIAIRWVRSYCIVLDIVMSGIIGARHLDRMLLTIMKFADILKERGSCWI